jgi:hypothetical protein
VFGNNAICTECGADLSRRRATRLGIRAHRKGLIGGGLAMLLPALLIGGALGWGWMSEINWQSYKPAWWLVRDLDSPKAPVSDAAVAELQRRMTLDELSSEATNDVVEWVLVRQADFSVPWKYPWGNLVEMAFDNGKVTGGQWERYAGNALTPSLAVRPHIRMGDPLPIRLDWEKRFGNIYKWEVYPLVDEVSVVGVVAEGERERGSMSFARSGMASSFGGISLDPEFTARIKAGSQETKVGLELLLRRGAKGGGTMTSGRTPFAQYHARKPVVLTGDVEVRGAETDPEWLVVNEGERAGMLSGLSVASLAPAAPPRGDQLLTAVIDTGAPRRIGGQVVVIAGGREIETESGGMSWVNLAGANRESGVTVNVGPFGVNGEPPRSVTIILLPDPEAAMNDINAAPYWGEAIVFRNVPVTSTIRTGSPQPPYFPATESIPVGPDGGVPQGLIDALSGPVMQPWIAP